MDATSLISAIEEIVQYENGKIDLDVENIQSAVIDVCQLRSDLGLSQAEFARRFKLPLGTIRNWEQGTRDPDRSAQLLLSLIEQNPQLIEKEVRRLRIA